MSQVKPDPCNSTQLSADGTQSQPANCKLFCLESQAQMLAQLMRYEGVIPQSSTATIVDEPETESGDRIVYGSDGRKIYGIHWSEPDPSEPSAPFTFDINAGLTLWAVKNYPPGHGDWTKNMMAGDVERIGLRGGVSDPNGRPGQTFVS